jgi:hypothetical protein
MPFKQPITNLQSLRGSSIDWGPCFMKMRLLFRIPHPLLCVLVKKKNTNLRNTPHKKKKKKHTKHN